MWDILTFRRMVTPTLLQLLFWLGMILCILAGIIHLFKHESLLALWWLVVAPLILRVIVELMMCLFAINNQLNDLRHLLSPSEKLDTTDKINEKLLEK